MKIIKWVELAGGIFLLKPALALFGFNLSEGTVQILLIFVFYYMVIEFIKEMKGKVEKYLSKQIQNSVKKEIKKWQGKKKK